MIQDVLRDKRHYYAFDEIESRRDGLLADESVIVVEDFGAGSKINKTPERKINAIAKNTLISPKFGQMLFRLTNYLQPAQVLEIGTSLGISTLYLAKACPKAKITTLEGSGNVAKKATEQFNALEAGNIRIVTGEFSATLPAVLAGIKQLDMAFIDGNHRFAPTLAYFELMLPYLNENSVLIFDDIHWSDEMEKAWEAVKSNPQVTLSLDLFFKGIVFFRKDFKQKSHLVLQF
ncbi:MAG: class I SAM-dependent methyltransferase [Bacteroidetes bacterium]|nr:class I SAM-dependent methyltransferase [Bacteroidota bacterium]